MKQTFELIKGIIISPLKTFEHIIKEKPFKIGLKIWLTSCLFSIIWIYAYFGKQGSFFDKFEVSSLLFSNPLLMFRFIYTVAAVFINTYIFNFVSIKLYKCQNNYATLLLCKFFTYVTTLVFASVSFFLLLILSTEIYSTVSRTLLIPYAIWIVILDIFAIKKVYRIHGRPAFAVFFYGSIATLLLYSGLKYLVKFIMP